MCKISVEPSYIKPRFCTYILQRCVIGDIIVIYFSIFFINSLKDFEYFKFLGTKFQIWVLEEANVSMKYGTLFTFLTLQMHISSKMMLVIFNFKCILHNFWCYIVMNFKSFSCKVCRVH